MAKDLESMSDEELEAIAGGDFESMPEEQLSAIAGKEPQSWGD